MTYDLLQWFRNPNWKVSHLEGLNQSGSTVIQHCHDTGKNLIFSKTTQYRGPWDVYSYDNYNIYEWITEAGWPPSCPLTNYKAYNPKVPGFPRFWNGNQSWSAAHSNCPVWMYTGCSGSPHGVNQLKFSMTGPTSYDFKGDVGATETIRFNYEWSPSDIEYRFGTLTHGWVLWQLWHNGVLTAWSNHNLVKPGIITPDFPCFAIP